MKTPTHPMVIVVGGSIALAAIAIGEHAARSGVERRLQESVAQHRQLELQFGEALTTHEQLKRDLAHEHTRAQDLSGALLSTRRQLEETVGRLAQELRGAGEMRTRLATTQEQMEQLQGELSVALQERQRAAGSSAEGAVQLERVVVSQGDAAGPEGRVMSIHRDWNFVVVDLGWDAVKIGETVSIYRDEQLLAKARVDRVQEGICAATILPAWKSAEVQVNDVVRTL